MADLELLTFEALAERITKFHSNARSHDVQAGWNKLLEMASQLGGSGAADQDPTVGRRWELTRIRICGYQGIGASAPLEIGLDPTPGITILHGPNGSGKSSIADAIETALHGTPSGPTVSGRGGTAPLWERVHTNRDADQAEIELSLICGDETLSIKCRLDAQGKPIDQSCNLSSSTSSTAIELTNTKWRSALAGHRPVFAYAAIERRVQRAKDLQEFLESLLAFGGCFEILEDAVESAAESSKTDKRNWDREVSVTKNKVDQVDQVHDASELHLLQPLAWPEVTDDPDWWLLEQGLAETGPVVQEITDDYRNRIVKTAAAAKTALHELGTQERSLHARLAIPLRQLHSEAKQLRDPGNRCPVCGVDKVQWLESLANSVKDLTALQEYEQTTTSKITALQERITSDLSAIHDVLRSYGHDSDGTLPGQAESEVFLAATRRDGCRPTNGVRTALKDLCTWVESDDFRSLVDAAKTTSDQLRQWRLARRQAVDDFIMTWRRVAPNARNYASWEHATKCLRTLREALRNERTEAIQTDAVMCVGSLLADAELTLRSISVQGTKASIEVVDATGETVSLAMLSAGQRNAILLAPILAASGSGPFGFLILDDPVHAFDAMRVDRVATLLAHMAINKRIVVLTHDERLREHLIAKSADFDVRTIERNPLTGEATLRVQKQMWEVLLEDAESILKVAGKRVTTVNDEVTNIARGLCRQALDNAVRQLVIRWSLLKDENPETYLKSLDEKYTTRDRLAWAGEIVTSHDEFTCAVETAQDKVGPHLSSWNQAAHGNPAPTGVTLGEIDAARRACQALAPAAP
jgi:energy-coupling factor transporter ATP-binding protein EcfA2